METKVNKEEQNELKQNRERGATMVEYGILVALLVGISIVIIQGMGEKIANQFQEVSDKIPN